MEQRVVIIGYGTAAVNAAIALRTFGFDGTITVLSEGSTIPYSPVLTSHYAGGEIFRGNCFPWSHDELASLNMDVHSRRPALHIDPQAHTVTTTDNVFEYDKCLIATGAKPITTGFPHADGYDPLVLRSIEDADFLNEALGNPLCKRKLVSGTSMVALKTVEACLRREKPVTLLGRSEHILKNSALESIAVLYEQALKSYGVELRLGQTADKSRLSARGIEITFSTGETDMFGEAVIAHGVTSSLSFVPEATLARDKGLLVDANMRTSDPDVYAAGDVAQTRDLLTGGTRIAGLWKDACLQGATAGRVMAAELAGKPVPSGAVYEGCVANNCVEVLDTVLLSGGSVSIGPSTDVHWHEEDFGVSATIYEGDKLVGFNVFASKAPTPTLPYDIAAMLMQRLMRGLRS